jgi:hypothetical protein
MQLGMMPPTENTRQAVNPPRVEVGTQVVETVVKQPSLPGLQHSQRRNNKEKKAQQLLSLSVQG